MTISNRPMTSLQQIQSELLKPQKLPQKVGQDIQTPNQFDQLLRQKIGMQDEVKFSKHANQRLEARQIELTNEQMLKLNQGIKSASAKGIRESLVLMDDMALVVNIPSKTVVTALSRQESQAHVFTNIDGAVVL